MSVLSLALAGCVGGWWSAPPERPERGPGAAAPGAEAALERVAVGSCSKQGRDLSVLEAVSATRPDLFVFLGDNVYGDERSADPSLPTLRRAYADLAAHPQFAAFQRQTPVLAVWDDHDYGANDAGADFPGRVVAERMFEEFWGDAHLGGGHPGVYGSRTWGPPGRRVQLLLLDTRSFRSPLRRSGAIFRGYQPDPAATLLGDDQWRWLEEALREPAEVRLLLSPTQILSDQHGYESWSQLPAEQERLFRLLRETAAEGVILVSGDRHFSAFYRHDTALPYPLVEFTSSSLNAPLWRNGSETGTHQLGAVYLPANFGLIDLDWDGGRALLQVRDPTGEPVREHVVWFRDLRTPRR